MKATWIENYLRQSGKDLSTLEKALMRKTKAELTDLGAEMCLELEGKKADMVASILEALRGPESVSKSVPETKQLDNEMEPVREALRGSEALEVVLEVEMDTEHFQTESEALRGPEGTYQAVMVGNPKGEAIAMPEGLREAEESRSLFWAVAMWGLDVVYGFLMLWDRFWIKLPNRASRAYEYMAFVFWPIMSRALQMALRASRTACKVSGKALWHISSLSIKTLSVALQMALGDIKSLARTIQEGWQMRASIIAECKTVA